MVSSVPNTTTQGPATAATDNLPSRSEAADQAFFADPNQPTNDEVDLPRIESAVRSILAAVGEDPDREGLLETPARVARMYAEMFAGLKSDPARHLAKVFTEDYDEIVLVRDISFCSELIFLSRSSLCLIADFSLVLSSPRLLRLGFDPPAPSLITG